MYRIEIPKDENLDSTLALMLEGYHFISNRRRKFQSDIFETRIKGEKVICISGQEAAEIFYNEELFQRKNAAPIRVRKTLFGDQAIQTLDDEAHVQRKKLFHALFTEEKLQDLKVMTKQEWTSVIPRWKNLNEVILFEEAKQVTCRIASRWTQVPIKESEISMRANDLWALVDAFSAVGPRHWRGRIARKKCNRWIVKLIKQVRQNQLEINEDSMFYQIVWHEELNGKLIDEQVAAVEIINILRPIVAISLYIVFGAYTFYTHPKIKEKLENGDDEDFRLFTQEVRRYYPFTPFTGARVREEFIWAGYHFKQNELVLLDIYGMNHDKRLWESPSEFIPERFKDFQASKYYFIPQGGGEFLIHHRCAGELVTIVVMEETFKFLTKMITYDIPKQNLKYSSVRMPPKVESGFVITNVHEYNRS